jgi:hydroxymethylpyrimidine pyrophosphatase-like HAD family hydrolase
LQAFPNAADLLNAPAILGNGSYLYDYAKNELLSPMFFKEDLGIRIAKYIYNTHPHTGMRILTPETTLYSLINEYINTEISQAWYKNISKYQAPEDWTGENWCKMVIRDAPEVLDDLRLCIERDFKGEDVEIFKSEADFLEIQAKGCNKGRGIKVLRDKFSKTGVPIKIYACGDYENDLAMLTLADVAVCPSNASDEVKRASDLCLCSCNDGLIAALINNL